MTNHAATVSARHDSVGRNVVGHDKSVESEKSVRLDKWLWAARFFRTRSLAKDAIEGGKVHYNGVRCKVGKEVDIGATVQIRQGADEKTVVVLALSGQRRGAPDAQRMYEETADSMVLREKRAEERRLSNEMMQPPAMRPNKRERRQLQRFHEQGGPETWSDE